MMGEKTWFYLQFPKGGRALLTTLLDRLAELYPDQSVQDLYKAVFQMCLGPEHILQDPIRALAYLSEEHALVDPQFLPTESLLLPLGRGVHRLNLRAAKRLGISVEQIGQAFLASAQIPQNKELLGDLVQQMRHLDLRRFGITKAEAEQSLTDIKQAGLPAVHHTAAYRKLYKPAYRLVYRDALPQEWLDLDLAKHHAHHYIIDLRLDPLAPE